jgi:alkylation response protein AidB-like acyl-CoA dehydrogenase
MAVIAKITGADYLWEAADSLVQMLGGRGYMETNLAPQILRDARVLRIGEGPNESLKIFLVAKHLRTI